MKLYQNARKVRFSAKMSESTALSGTPFSGPTSTFEEVILRGKFWGSRPLSSLDPPMAIFQSRLLNLSVPIGHVPVRGERPRAGGTRDQTSASTIHKHNLPTGCCPGHNVCAKCTLVHCIVVTGVASSTWGDGELRNVTGVVRRRDTSLFLTQVPGHFRFTCHVTWAPGYQVEVSG